MALTPVLVCYDISETRALRRVARLLGAFGQRAQKSVFECHLTPRQRGELVRRLRAEHDRATGGFTVRLYTLPGARATPEVVGDPADLDAEVATGAYVLL